MLLFRDKVFAGFNAIGGKAAVFSDEFFSKLAPIYADENLTQVLVNPVPVNLQGFIDSQVYVESGGLWLVIYDKFGAIVSSGKVPSVNGSGGGGTIYGGGSGTVYTKFIVAIGDDPNLTKPDWADYYAVRDTGNNCYVVPFSAWQNAGMILFRNHPNANTNSNVIVIEIGDYQYRTLYLLPFTLDGYTNINNKDINVRRVGSSSAGQRAGEITVGDNTGSIMIIADGKVVALKPNQALATY